MPVEPVPCAPEPAEPPCCSPGVASTGLCLSDGTPISVLAVTACGECGGAAAAPEVSGWLNLLTGAFTAGSPPAGTEACLGQPQQFEVGQWCDLDTEGEVIAPVLVEYEYDDTGQLIGVRTLTPGGDPYAVVGTLGICPGAVNDVEYVLLCDTGTDGTVTEFLRQLTPNGDGTSSTSDTLLDGTTPYTPVGRVGACGGSLVPCGTGTGGTPGVSGPITSGNEELSSVALSRPISPATEHEVPGMGALITGGTWHLPATKCGVSTSGQDHGLGALRLPAVPRPLCDAGTVQVTIRLTYAQEGPDVGQASTGALFLMYHQPDGSAVQAGGHAFPQNTPVGSTGVREVTASIPADRLAAGQVYAVVSAETWQKSFNVPPRCKAWTFSEWSAEYAYDVTGCPDLPPPPLAQLVKVCPTDPIPVTVEPGKDTEVAVLCDVAEDGTVTEFLRAYQVDSESGLVGVVADTLLDGVTPFEPLGEVGLCDKPCQDCETLTLCEVVPDESPGGPDIEFEAIDLASLSDGPTSGSLANGVNWTVSCGQWLSPQGHYTIYPTSGGGSPACDMVWAFDQPVYARFGLRGFNVGPGECLSWASDTGAEFIVESLNPNHEISSTPNTICGLGTAADESVIVSSAPVSQVTLSAINNPGQGRGIGLAEVGLVTEPSGPGSVVSFLRTVCRDCSGAVISTTDTTLGGEPYTPAGQVISCAAASSIEPEPCRDSSSTLLCDLSVAAPLTLMDTTGVQDSDDWTITSWTDAGCTADVQPDGTVPFPAWWGTGMIASGGLGVRADQYLGSVGCSPVPWSWETAPVRWVMTKTFVVAKAGMATLETSAFQGDGEAQIRINGVYTGVWGRWNLPSTATSSPVPVVAGVNTVEIEVRDYGGPNYVSGRVDLVTTGSVQFLRKIVTDCVSGETVSVTDTTLNGLPYVVSGEVGQCEETAAACCDVAAPETRVDIESDLQCLFDAAGEVVAQVVVERIYDDLTGIRIEQRLTDPTTGEAVELPDGATLGSCPAPGMVVCGLDPDDPDAGITGSITTGTDVDPKATFVVQPDPISQQVSYGLAASLGGASTVIPSWTQTTNCGSSGQANGWQAVRLPAVPRPACDDGTVTVTIGFNLRNDGPTGSMGGWVNARLVGVSAGVETIYALAQGGNAPAVGVTKPLLLSAPLPSSVLAAGELYWDIRIETRQAGCKSWTVSDAVAGYVFGIEGCETPPQYAQLVKFCEPITVTPLPAAPEQDIVILCDTDPDGAVVQFVRDYLRDSTGGVSGHHDYTLDGAEYTVVGEVGVCGGSTEPCRDSSSTMLCDTAAQEALTVFDPTNRPGADGWQVVSYTGVDPTHPAEAPLPYDAPHPAGSPAFMGARSDLSAGVGPSWPGYDTAPHRWVLRKTFTAPEDGVAVVSSAGFRGDGGARVRVNGSDAGMYGQWNLPATTGTAQIPVTAGPNTVEIEVRDGAGPNWVQGRLDIVMTATVQFMRRTVVDCATGETVAVVDTTLDGDPYEVTGLVGQCEPVAECCEQPPPEQRVDVETTLLCVRDEATGEILGQVIAERVYDDQSGDLVEQRLTDLAGDPFTLLAGTELAKCPSPDRITRQVCVVESGVTEFLTNSANATSGVDSDWQWSPDLDGTWHPMYRVAPNPAWTVTDTAPNQAHWVGPHVDRTVCPTAGETSPPVPETWYTRASWNLPVDVTPESIRIAATVLNADNDVVRWRLGDGPWQPVGTAGLSGAAWTFPPTAVPGGRAGQNEIVVQLFEGQPGVTCPSPNSAGMLLHVIATYDHEPLVWTQVIEPGGQTYYLDENGDRQDAIPDGRRLVACGGGGDAPCCPPEARVDVECDVMCVQGTDGELVRQVVVERVYDDQTGIRAVQRFTDPTTGEEVELPDGAELVLCPPGPPEGRDVELLPMCVLDNITGGSVQRIVAEVSYDSATGERLGVAYVDPATWGPVALPGGTHIGLCPDVDEPTPDVEVVELCDLVDGESVPFLRHLVYAAGVVTPTVVDSALDGVTPYTAVGTVGACRSGEHVVEQCRCDDTDGDGIGETDYVELIVVDTSSGALTSIGTYLPDFSGPYTPVAPVECPAEGAEPAAIVQARRIELTAGGTWSAASVPLLQSVTATAHDGPGVITTVDGTSTLHAGESVSWSVARDDDSFLSGPLAITAGHDAATVTVAFTTATAT